MRHRKFTLVHVELHTDDSSSAVDFLSQLVGWRTEEIHHRCGSYLSLEVGDRVGGGVVQCGAQPAQWLPYVVVGDVAGSTRRAEDLGAAVLVGPREGVAGWRSVVTTPASGMMGLWQPKTS